jgi:hypothetical protein
MHGLCGTYRHALTALQANGFSFRDAIDLVLRIDSYGMNRADVNAQFARPALFLIDFVGHDLSSQVGYNTPVKNTNRIRYIHPTQ